MPENWTEYEIVDKRSILAEAEDIIVEFTQMCASIFSDKVCSSFLFLTSFMFLKHSAEIKKKL